VLAEPANVCEAEKLLFMLSRLTFADKRESLSVPLVRSEASVVADGIVGLLRISATPDVAFQSEFTCAEPPAPTISNFPVIGLKANAMIRI
jgi:hypothetical protein